MPDETKRDMGDEFLKWMCRHLVALTASYESYNADGSICGKGVFAFSGFVMNLHGLPFWITAGHCLETLDSLYDPQKGKVWGMEFRDDLGTDAKHHGRFPFVYEQGDAFVLHRPELQLDFAALPLSGITFQAFAANGIKAVTRENWINQGKLDFQAYRLLGIPADWIIPGDSELNVPHHIAPASVLVEPLTRDEIDDPPPEGWFIGRIHPEAKIKDIAGMSGGPIFGFRKLDNGRWVYHIVAVQSRWLDQSRVIFGCSIPLFAELLYKDMIDAGFVPERETE